MGITKDRLTVTVDSALVGAAQEAVAEGRAESVSAWVNLALSELAARERRLRAMAAAVAAYEAECGTITPAQMAAQERADRAAALVVRGGKRVAARKSGKRTAA